MKKISKYQIFTELQHGPITRVYKAIQPELQRMVLVKQLNPDLVLDDELIERFKQEGSILAKINSANVITIFDFGFEDSVPFLVTEFIEGNTLAELLETVGHFPWDICLHILQQITAGVQAIHRHNLIHQDIKPENIFISNQGEVKLGDLGFSVSLADKEKQVQGTPAYLPPEVILESEMDFRGDLYALGLVAFEMLTGDNPFAADDMQTIFNRIVNLQPRSVNGIRPDVPPEFSEIVAKLMKRDPAERIQSADALVQKLEQVRASVGVKVDRQSLVRFLNEPGAYQMTRVIREEKPVPPAEQKQSQQPRLWMAAGLIVTAIIFIFFLQQLSDGFSFFKKTDIPPIENQNHVIAPDDSSAHFDSNNKINDKPTDETLKTNAEITRPNLTTRDTATIPIAADVKRDTIFITSDPKSVVFLNNDSLGITPLAIGYTSGADQFALELRSPGFPIIKKMINPGDATAQNFHINLWKEVAYLDVAILPWGEIWMDGDSIDVSPMNRLIVLSPGNHRLTVRHPTLKNVTVPFFVAVGETLRKTIELQR